MKSILALFLALSGLASQSGADSTDTRAFSEVADISSLPLLNPDFASRKTAKLRLDNGLEILLISDADAELSAASVAVGAGSWNDPLEFAGMAHFCEHMLFMGTQKYPDENEFLSSVSDHGGMTNAMTSSDRTVYMFSSNADGFLPLLDRFAHFFIDPLFKPANISREMHAVDQEFAKSVENDGWRTMMVLKETGNPDHPNRMFNCGNSATLSQIPQSALVQWHRAHYSADRIHAVIYSSLSLDILKEKAIDAFRQVPVAPPVYIDPSLSITSPEQRGHITYIKPIQNKQSLSLLWELPRSLSDDPTHSADLIAYALKRGQKNSLYEKLKEEQLIETLSIDVDDIGGKEHRFFEISLELTEKGMKQPDLAVLRVFQSIALLRSTGLPNYLFQEMNRVAELKYQYQSRQDPFSYVMKIGLTLPDEPLETYPRSQVIASEYSPQKIAEASSWLTPDRCTILFLAPSSQPFEHREQWLGAEYAVRPIPADWMNAWVAAAPNSQIRLPEPNPFVPQHLTVIPDSVLGANPILIAQNELGTAYYARCGEFKNPETSIRLHLLSPELNPSARSQVLAALYCNHLADSLHPILAAANQANLNAAIQSERSRIHIKIDGFSEKASVLLQEILPQLSLNPPTREQFSNLCSELEKGYANSQKDLAFRQAKDLLDSLINQDKATAPEKLAALKGIQYEDFLAFHKKLFEKTYIEAFFGGNLTLKEAESAWLDVIHVLGRTPFPKSDHSQTKVARLPEGPYSIAQTTEVQGNAALLLIDEGSFTFQKRASQEILAAGLKEAFFNELRTKQKTGYIAASDSQEIEERLFQFFVVQSNSHQPEELLYRFELFLEEFLETFSDKVSKERFETLQQSAVSSIKNRFCNLKEKSGLWDLLAFQYRGDFRFLDKRIAAIQNLSYEEFSQISKEFLSRQNRKRLAVLFEGKLASPFSYESTTPLTLSEIATYAPRPEKISEESAAAANP